MNDIQRIKGGLWRIQENKILILIPTIYLVLAYFVSQWGSDKLLALQLPYLSAVYLWVFKLLMIGFTWVGLLVVLMVLGYPKRARKCEKQLTKIGFVDNAGIAPMLIAKKKEKNGYILDFYSDGISLAEYKKHSAEIETALNIKIVSIERGRNMQHVILKVIRGSNGKQGILMWSDSFLSDKDFEIVLGESYFGVESLDFAITPHILIGGGTNSGKTKLLKLILMQSVKKGANVFIADFKGGIDYPKIWHERCSIITTAEALEQQLNEILRLMEERRELLIKTATTNIHDYNKKTGAQLPRIIVACDELAEVLDKTGLDKEEKNFVANIESKLSTIARLGRAFGIHLILATQRPDAEILKGQIKVNLPFRICGRADKVLSQIILDNTEAAEKITPQDQGIFLTNTGVLFQAYYDEEDFL